MEDSPSGQRWSHNVLPGLYHTAHIFAFLSFAVSFPEDPLAPEARRQARIFGDWLVQNTLPEDAVYSRFPFSLVRDGTLEEVEYGTTVTRAGRVGIAMLALHKVFGDDAYLEYARHLADGLAKFQRDDGSWPFRVKAQDGTVLWDYTSNAIEPARLFGLLEEIAPNDTYRNAREKAIEWTLEGPVRTNRWESMYEDGPASPPYVNLENLDTLEVIRYLVHYSGQNPEFVETAERVNRWIENQFVLWHTGDCVAAGEGGWATPLAPTIFEARRPW